MAPIDTLSQGNPRSKLSLLLKILGLSIFILASTLTVSNSTEAREHSPEGTPTGWRTSYTQIHFDDVETLVPSLGPSFILTNIGTITGNPAEVIEGTYSIKGLYAGTEEYNGYLQTDPSILPFTPLHTYRITFEYRILVTPDQGFETLFYSPTGDDEGNWLPSITIQGQAGDSGTATLTNTLLNYSDYMALWNIVGTGSIAIDNIEILDMTTGQPVASEDAELVTPGLSPGLVGGAGVTTDPNLVIDGNASLRLNQHSSLQTDPAVLPLEPNQTYIVEFDYRVLDPGGEDEILGVWFRPVDSSDPDEAIYARNMLKNAPSEGTFSAGALTADASNYSLNIGLNQNASIVIDNLKILHQERSPISHQPANWALMPWIPYPRLGNYLQGTTTWIAQGAVAEGVPFTYSVEEIEERLAFSDVVAGFVIGQQANDPDFARRLRNDNANIILLPYRIAQEQSMDPSENPPSGPLLDPAWIFRLGVADEWIVKDTFGNPVPDPGWIYIRKMNISDYSPVINGQTFNDYLVNWVVDTVMASGVWDGIFFDNLFDRINPHILNFNDPALLNYDVNLNGERDETPAWVSDMTRAAAIKVLQMIRGRVADLEIIMGNTGSLPATSLAPYANGYIFECVDEAWDSDWRSVISEAGWRQVLEAYFYMGSATTEPRINIMEACGRTGAIVEPDHQYLEPTGEDIAAHRFTLGTALLGDGFYEYDLFDARSAPYWFDEYTVDQNGVAVEDRKHRGYLGLALNNAKELKTPATTVWEQEFDEGVLPPEMWADSGVYVGTAASDVISGTGSLVIDNPDHTQQAYITTSTDHNQVVLVQGETYVIEFDWLILETLDGGVDAYIWGGEDNFDAYPIPGIVAGDAGKAHFPITLTSGSDFRLSFTLGGGGGKVAIDNIRLTEGGAGPWRRDFENGFVLVNPIHRAYTFNTAELAGPLNRTGIKRILGAQAPLVNNGQPVTATLTLQPFDAIILLADHIPSENQLHKVYLPLSVKE